VSYEHVNADNVAYLMTLGGAVVDEGGSVVVGPAALDVSPLGRRLADLVVDVRYSLVAPPRHGALQVYTQL